MFCGAFSAVMAILRPSTVSQSSSALTALS
jgi:hypothetical protein